MTALPPAGCERTWPSDHPTMADDTTRQHRCGKDDGHSGVCVCRYCQEER